MRCAPVYGKFAETYNRKAGELSLPGFCFTRRKSLPYL